MESTALKNGHSQNIIGGRIQETMVSKSGLEMSSKDGIVNCVSPKKNGCFTIAIEGNIGSGKSTMINYFKQFEEVQVHAGLVTSKFFLCLPMSHSPFCRFSQISEKPGFLSYIILELS